MKIMNEYYKTYTAEFVNTNKFPKVDFDRIWHNTESLQPGTVLISKSRCKALKCPISENEAPVAYKRVNNGYVGLYDRTGKVDIQKLYDSEIIGSSNNA